MQLLWSFYINCDLSLMFPWWPTCTAVHKHIIQIQYVHITGDSGIHICVYHALQNFQWDTNIYKTCQFFYIVYFCIIPTICFVFCCTLCIEALRFAFGCAYWAIHSDFYLKLFNLLLRFAFGCAYWAIHSDFHLKNLSICLAITNMKLPI